MRYAVVVVMMLAAAVAFAGDVPDYGVYEPTDDQLKSTGEGFRPVENDVDFIVAYAPDDPEVGLIWDYDGDGLGDEEVELYRHEMTESGLLWKEGDLWYVLYKDSGEHWLMMMFPDDTTYAIRLHQRESL